MDPPNTRNNNEQQEQAQNEASESGSSNNKASSQRGREEQAPAPRQQHNRQLTQAELDAESKRRAAGRGAAAPASRPGVTSVSEPAPRNSKGAARNRSAAAASGAAATAPLGAAASRQAVERNMEDRDALAKRRAAARGVGANQVGAYATRNEVPEPLPPPPRVETAATAEAPPTAAAARAVSAASFSSYGTTESAAAAAIRNQLYANQDCQDDEDHQKSSSSQEDVNEEVATAMTGHPSPVQNEEDIINDAAVAAAIQMDYAAEEEIDFAAEEDIPNEESEREFDVVTAEAAVAQYVPSQDFNGGPNMEEAPYTYPGADPNIATDVPDFQIEAFVADTVVDATGVAVVMSEEDEFKFEQARRKRCLLYGAIVLVILAASIVVPVVIFVGGSGEEKFILPPPSIAPSGAPSAAPSGAPTTDTFSVFLEYLSGLNITKDSDPFDMDYRNSPQYKAALWLATEDGYTAENGLNPEDPRLMQRYALATLYFSTAGDDWKLCGRNSPSCGDTIWLTDGNECDWFVVGCEQNNIVDQINFPSTGNDLIGTLPAEISLFTGLKRFLAPENSLKGDLDVAFGGLTTLQTLVVADNRHTGTIPTGILAFNPNLSLLVLGGNQFIGTLPEGLAGATMLTDLQLHENSLTGTIPKAIGNLSALRKLELQNNNLVGTIPDDIYSLTKITSLQLHENQGINGTISPLISKLSLLTTLQLGFTGLGGEIPTEMFVLTDLSEMNLENAQFSGTIPELFKNLNASLMDLLLNNNRFTGSVPVAFDYLTALETLQIQGNEITGTISAQICVERGLRFQQLATLIVDCVVVCDCCDNCKE